MNEKAVVRTAGLRPAQQPPEQDESMKELLHGCTGKRLVVINRKRLGGVVSAE